MCMRVYLFVYVHMHTGAKGVQKGESEPMELEP